MNTSTNGPIRVAHVIGKLNAAGVEAVINNYYRFIDHSKYQFDFIIDSDGECQPKQELIDMGARYYIVPPYQKLPKYMRELTKLFRENQYQIVHSSLNTLSVFPLCAAKAAGVPIRINHNHSTAAPGDTKRNLMKYALRPFAVTYATHLCACSEYSGEWLFGKKAMEQSKVTVFKNAIDTEKFAFDPVIREKVREELNIPDDAFVIGHVGRFCYQKNQEFLIDIFEKVYAENTKAVLLMVGIGETMGDIREKVNHFGLTASVVFTGARSDVNRLYQAMDVFVLPSRYEGLPVVAVEAQAAGLPVLISDHVTKEAKVSEQIRFLSIDDLSEWVVTIQQLHPSSRNIHIDPRFDIRSEAIKLECYYDQILSNSSLLKE